MIQELVSMGGESSSDKPPPTSHSSQPQSGTNDGPADEWPSSTSPQWKDWRWQMRNRIRSLDELSKRFPELPITPGMTAAMGTFPMAVPPYYASLIRKFDPSDPIFQMCVPQEAELVNPSFLEDDPLGEDGDMPVPGLVHRYADRALLISTSTCASYCRHCTRKRVAGHVESVISSCRLNQAVEYLRSHPEVKDVVVSGGDPFTLSTPTLERILSAVRSVPSVEIIRVGTRTPVTMPMRITPELVNMLRRYHPLFVNTHFNHPAELTPESMEACARLADAGIPVGNQTVLLRGVNDDPEILATLFRGMVRNRVRPYYLFQCDLVHGVEHFRTPLSRGVEIMDRLRGRLSGLAIPTFVVDAPHGGGKIPVLPNYVLTSTPAETVLRNYKGEVVSYPEPQVAAESTAPSSTGRMTRKTSGTRKKMRQPSQVSLRREEAPEPALL